MCLSGLSPVSFLDINLGCLWIFLSFLISKNGSLGFFVESNMLDLKTGSSKKLSYLCHIFSRLIETKSVEPLTHHFVNLFLLLLNEFEL